MGVKSFDKKSHVLHLGSSNPEIDYALSHITLPKPIAFKDLGVTIDRNLRFSIHICDIVKRAHQRAALILRCFKTRDHTVLVRAFNTYVRPLVEYCSPVWAPCYLGDIIKIESVQRKFTRRLNGLSTMTYRERLAKLKVESLELRRLRADLILYYKIIHKMVIINDNVISLVSNPYNLRGHDKRLLKPRASVNCRAHSFAARVIDAWNSLPQNVVSATSVNGFKVCLIKIDLSRWLHI
jgi:hypothetical protein